jgi:hypothetical protein
MTEWIRIIALAIQLFHNTEGEKNTSLVIQRDDLNRIGLNAPEGKQALFVSLISDAGRQELCNYVFIPWQNIYEKNNGKDSIDWMMYEVFTVNELAIIYRSERAVLPRYKDAVNNLDRFIQFFTSRSANQKLINKQDGVSSTDSVRFISIKEYPFYSVQEVAMTGTAAVSPDIKEPMTPGKMLYHILIPDQGQVKASWIFTGEAISDECFKQSANAFLDIFSRNIKHCLVDVNQKDNLFVIAQDEIIDAAAKCTNGKQMEERMTDLLRRLLNKRNRNDEMAMSDLYSDYQPKTTPDVATDYMPELISEFRLIPDADTANTEDLIGLFNIYTKAAKRNPGKWENGNMILGAKEKEYSPSKEELILNEIGERIKKLAESSKPATLSQVTKTTLPKQIRFKHFTFTHTDVMGSGRFFYVDNMQEITVKLK